MRGPFNLGPARRVVENPFIIIIGKKRYFRVVIFPAYIFKGNMCLVRACVDYISVKNSPNEDSTQYCSKTAVLQQNKGPGRGICGLYTLQLR